MASDDSSSSSSSDTDSDNEHTRDSGYNSKLRAGRKRKRRSAMASDDNSSSSGSDIDSDSEHTRDSGYNSDSSDAVAEYLKQRRAQHESAGPALSDPCRGTRRMMRAERKQWKR